MAEPYNPYQGQTLSPYEPTLRDRIAAMFLGSNPSFDKRRSIEGLIGSSGLGNTGFSLADMTGVGGLLDAQQEAASGNYRNAAMAMLPGMKQAKVAGKVVEDVANKGVKVALKTLSNQYHPASRLKFEQPLEDMRFDVRPMNTLAPAKTIDIADIMGEVAVPAYGDRTITDAMIHGINGEQFLTPTHAQGGVDFMRKLGGTAGWASEPSAMATKAKFVQSIGQKYDKEPILTYTAMGAQAGDFSRHMSDAVMQQIRPSMHNMIDPRVVKKYDAFVRDKIDPKWPGILSPKTQPYIAKDMTGSDRRLLWQELDKKKYRDAGFPSIGSIRLAITDPRLVNVDPFATGLGMSKVDLSAPLVETAPELHSTYRSRMPANYIGGLLDSVPGNLVWRDFFNARRASGAGPASDQRSFMMNPSVNQVVDQQMVDEVSKYLEDQLKAKR